MPSHRIATSEIEPVKFEQQKSLKDLNWWKVGGSAQFFLQPQSIDDLIAGLAEARARTWAVHVLSGGSNVLVADHEISGLVISLRSLNRVLRSEVVPTEGGGSGRAVFECEAGVAKSEAAKFFLQKKLAPAVFLTGIPGDVGGGVVMNAGVGEARTPREFCEIVDWIDVVDTSADNDFPVRRRGADELHWTYRHSAGWQPGVIVRVGLSWPADPDPQVMEHVRDATRKRVATQPLTQPSCGSVFRNPPGHKSAKLIEQCGLKGLTVGGAQVSLKHANFIVNLGSATAQDIQTLIAKVRATVLEKTGVSLETEVRLFGFSSDTSTPFR
jgi:UDP-N-acetylmuramate dehydrogenase